MVFFNLGQYNNHFTHGTKVTISKLKIVYIICILENSMIHCNLTNSSISTKVIEAVQMQTIKDNGTPTGYWMTVVINNYHKKLGHAGAAVIKGTMHALGIVVKSNLHSCKACCMAKARAKAMQKVTNVWSALWGKFCFRS